MAKFMLWMSNWFFRRLGESKQTYVNYGCWKKKYCLLYW